MPMPVAKKINWKKDDGWSKHEQVGRNQAIEDCRAYLSSPEAAEKVAKILDSTVYSRRGKDRARAILSALTEGEK